MKRKTVCVDNFCLLGSIKSSMTMESFEFSYKARCNTEDYGKSKENAVNSRINLNNLIRYRLHEENMIAFLFFACSSGISECV